MNKFLLAAVCLLSLLPGVRAQQSGDEKYLAIYGLIQEAVIQSETSEPRQALESLLAAQAQLQQFHKVYPDWHPGVVSYRLDDLANRIAETKAKLAAAPTPPPEPTNSVAVETAGGRQSAATQTAAQEESLRAQLQAAQAENQTLQAKLKEALSSQPPAAEVGELDKAREEIRTLMKLNDLLQAGADLNKNTNGVAALRRQLNTALAQSSAEHGRAEKLTADNASLQRELKRVTRDAGTLDASTITDLRQENARLKSQLASASAHSTPSAPLAPSAPSVAAGDTASTKGLKAKLKAANDQIASLKSELEKNTKGVPALRRQLAAALEKYSTEQALAEKLIADNKALQAQIQPGNPEAGALAALREENTRLKAQLSAAPTPAADSTSASDLAAQLKTVNAQVASLQTTIKVAAQEKGVLENKVRELSAEMDKLRADNAEGRIRDLTKERDELSRELALVGKKTSGKKADAQMAALTDELQTLRARLTVAEAKPAPYSAEELALLRGAAPQPQAGPRSIHDLPSGVAELVTSAQRHFANHEYAAAEADYQKILDRDQNNGLVLANLASIELEQGKLADAEKHITAALAQSPDDAYNLSTIGYLKFRQEKYDEALDYLSRAAKLDPNDPAIQNYLGVTLSHKGLRVQAEAALRKAVQINPLYAPAHNNLAVVYLNQTPPMPGLARWHYEKAVAAGQPRSPDLERLLADKGAPFQPPQ